MPWDGNESGMFWSQPEGQLSSTLTDSSCAIPEPLERGTEIDWHMGRDQ